MLSADGQQCSMKVIVQKGSSDIQFGEQPVAAADAARLIRPIRIYMLKMPN